MLPDDVIFRKDDEGHFMYFCVEGSLNVLSSDGKRVVNTIQAGGYFGEIALFTKFQRKATIKATTFCLLKEISLEELNLVLESFPNEKEHLKQLVTQRHKQQIAKQKAPIALAEEVNAECVQLIGSVGVNEVISVNDKNSSSESFSD